ncbi:DNA polymerase alpha catalytic subunit-like [Temnothorax curvispinosus]|uniref:DNA polymerase alpha catalytic subunit-like n=1 Tax=Temnothorax curvispinosus TaxID=300111 RepID=A0A6J1Q7N8_9HYME|nr:DNA polymerase alpha catalytic subunit-like [Temnothorax curvispinosus]
MICNHSAVQRRNTNVKRSRQRKLHLLFQYSGQSAKSNACDVKRSKIHYDYSDGSQYIARASNHLFSRTLLGGRAERNEYLLLHAFNLKDYITLDTKIEKKGRGDDKSEEAVTGGDL